MSPGGGRRVGCHEREESRGGPSSSRGPCMLQREFQTIYTHTLCLSFLLYPIGFPLLFFTSAGHPVRLLCVRKAKERRRPQEKIRPIFLRRESKLPLFPKSHMHIHTHTLTLIHYIYHTKSTAQVSATMPYEKSRRAGPAAVQPQPQPQPEQQQQSRIRSTSMSMSGSGPSPISIQQSGDYANQSTATRARRDSRILSATTTSSISIGNSGTSTVNLDITQGSFRSSGGGDMVDMEDNSNNNNSINVSGSGRQPPQQQDLVFVDLTLRGQDPLGKSASQMNNGNGGGRGRAGSVGDAPGGMVIPEPSWGACMPIYA